MINSDSVFQKLQSLTPSKQFLIAYSGGLDSHVLLHLMSHLTDSDIKVRALHINHGLQKEAESWVVHCQNICKNLSIPFHHISIDLQIKKSESVEDAARKGRYKALLESLQENEVLLTAHHQNDQAETFLLQLFRGAGVNGLAAMPEIREVSVGSKLKQHARPLLDLPLQSLKVYAKQYGLDYIQDPSNKSDVFDRNFLRNQIMPQLKSRWPGLDKTISRSASIQAESKLLLDELAEQELKLIVSNKDNTISIAKLLQFSAIKQKLVMRYWITQSGFVSPSDKKLAHIFFDVVKAREDAQPLIEWQDVQIRRYQNRLYIMSALVEHDHTKIIQWDTDKPLQIPELGVTLQPQLITSSKLINKKSLVTVRFRQGGETLMASKKGISISLKNLLHEAGIPPWLRSRIPLIFIDNELTLVVGVSD